MNDMEKIDHILREADVARYNTLEVRARALVDEVKALRNETAGLDTLLDKFNVPEGCNTHRRVYKHLGEFQRLKKEIELLAQEREKLRADNAKTRDLLLHQVGYVGATPGTPVSALVTGLVDEVKELRADMEPLQLILDALPEDLDHLTPAEAVKELVASRERLRYAAEEVRGTEAHIKELLQGANLGFYTTFGAVKHLIEVRDALDAADAMLDEAGVPKGNFLARVQKLAADAKDAPGLRGQRTVRLVADLDPSFPDIRPEVLAFAMKMEAKLRQRDDRPHWKNEKLPDLLAGLMVEVGELAESLRNGVATEAIVDEARDVANYAMFIADSVEGLEP